MLPIKHHIINWIKLYFEDTDAKAVIGISGGKDSSVAAALCAEALGSSRVFGVLLPNGEQWDVETARKLVKHLNIPHIELNIKDVNGLLLTKIEQTGLTLNNIATTNTPARVRMTILYAVSAILNGRVANTCNLSEDYVGYATKFGDGAGDFAPLKNLTSTEIVKLAHELNLPPDLADKTPEDGLSGKTDEENLGFSYETLDNYIKTGKCPDENIKAKIDTLHKANLHKLEPIPSPANRKECFTCSKPQ